MTTTTTTPTTSQPSPTQVASRAEGPLRPAPLPTGAGRIGWLGPLLAVLLIGVAVVLGQDAWTRLGGGQNTWLGSAISGLNGLAPSTALAVPAVVAVLLGLVLLLTAFSRRTRKALVLRGDLGAHLTTRDVARLAAGAARQVDGVLDASVTATRRKVSVEVVTTGDSATADAVQGDVARALSALVSAPRVSTTTKTTAKEGTR
ncbi:hypothetical protein SAMN06264364_11749 [Quadrisphaera granulorum]|uniref:DUF6286 domain-containing protein n=1 Tax=Quadrisphaera granulorum TaxID=317664 RepID=A0A316ARS5_9ACTN|nr:DUF6286 domain-containing protein [Quadrisphaera granulorum]PWJ52797.1 hypothetical protein BXY45_11749 [Quadrisphaera granulorum]SZE97402.1 hypothetical protein SAMN06264364_11749 [Quadrisphaera granulorum]